MLAASILGLALIVFRVLVVLVCLKYVTQRCVLNAFCNIAVRRKGSVSICRSGIEEIEAFVSKRKSFKIDPYCSEIFEHNAFIHKGYVLHGLRLVAYYLPITL